MFEENKDAANFKIVVKLPAAPSTRTYHVLGKVVAAEAAYRRHAKFANAIRAYEDD